MRALKRLVVLAAVIAVPLVAAGPASADPVSCTAGYPATLASNPHDPRYITIYPHVGAHGPVNYTMHIVNGTFGYVNCVL